MTARPGPRWRRPAALTVMAIAAASALAGCGGDGDDGAPATTTVTEGTDGVASTATTAADPIALGTVPSLDLAIGQCFAEEPAPDGATPTTVAAAEATSAPVLLVDCAGAHDGRVYHAACLVPSVDGPLLAGACPGLADTAWPGDRELRRAAVRVCLDRFAEELGEPYATSDRTTVELVPTQEAWADGARRVVCAVEP